MQIIVNTFHLLSSNISNTFNKIVMMEITLNCVDNVTIKLKNNMLSVVAHCVNNNLRSAVAPALPEQFLTKTFFNLLHFSDRFIIKTTD